MSINEEQRPNDEAERDERHYPSEQPAEAKSKRAVITVMTISFTAAMLFMISRGGTCERYERKMNQQQQMRNYIDSMRMESDKKKSQ